MSQMQQYYSLTDEQYEWLKSKGVSDLDLLRNEKHFDTGYADHITKISLMEYIQKHGDFNKPPTRRKHKIIAKAIYNSLVVDLEDILFFSEYIEDTQDYLDGILPPEEYGGIFLKSSENKKPPGQVINFNQNEEI